MKKNFLTAAAFALLATATAFAAPLNPRTASQPSAFVNQSAVKTRLGKLMGPVNQRFMQRNFGTVSSLQADEQVGAVTGCRPHDCADNGSLVIYDRAHDALAVWLTVNGKTRTFKEKGWQLPQTANSDVKASVENLSN